jgi:hypothetical protein
MSPSPSHQRVAKHSHGEGHPCSAAAARAGKRNAAVCIQPAPPVGEMVRHHVHRGRVVPGLKMLLSTLQQAARTSSSNYLGGQLQVCEGSRHCAADAGPGDSCGQRVGGRVLEQAIHPTGMRAGGSVAGTQGQPSSQIVLSPHMLCLLAQSSDQLRQGLPVVSRPPNICLPNTESHTCERQ